MKLIICVRVAKADIAMDGGQEEDPKFFQNSPSPSDTQARAVSFLQETMPSRSGENRWFISAYIFGMVTATEMIFG